MIKLVIAKGAKSESDQKQESAENGQSFCFLADLFHATVSTETDLGGEGK